MSYKTIYALSTPAGKSGVAVVRVSGQNAFRVLEKMTEIDAQNLKARHAYFTKLFSV